MEHGKLPQGRSVAVAELGVRVLNCDKGKAMENNAAFANGLRRGYKILRGAPERVQESRPRRLRPSLDDATEQASEEPDIAGTLDLEPREVEISCNPAGTFWNEDYDVCNTETNALAAISG